MLRATALLTQLSCPQSVGEADRVTQGDSDGSDAAPIDPSRFRDLGWQHGRHCIPSRTPCLDSPRAQAVPAAIGTLLDMGRITVADRGGWSAPDAEVAELLAAARDAARSPEALAVLSGLDPAGELRLEGGVASRPVAVALRVAIGLICARYLDSASPDPAAAAQRDRLYELDQLLQRLIAPRRGRYPTFPSRRHHQQLTARGIEPAAVAPLIGLSLDDAELEARKLGLRVSTGYMLLNRAPGQLDVLADDGEVTNILGLHI
jgi:hypothetical protein